MAYSLGFEIFKPSVAAQALGLVACCCIVESKFPHLYITHIPQPTTIGFPTSSQKWPRVRQPVLNGTAAQPQGSVTSTTPNQQFFLPTANSLLLPQPLTQGLWLPASPKLLQYALVMHCYYRNQLLPAQERYHSPPVCCHQHFRSTSTSSSS